MANTGNIFIDTLAGISWLDVGGDRNITYYLDEAVGGHRPWRVLEAPMWEIALHQWANVANITTQRLSSAAGADLQEMWRTNAEMQGIHGSPFVSFHTLPSTIGPCRRRIQHAIYLCVFHTGPDYSRRIWLRDFPARDRPRARSRGRARRHSPAGPKTCVSRRDRRKRLRDAELQSKTLFSHVLQPRHKDQLGFEQFRPCRNTDGLRYRGHSGSLRPQHDLSHRLGHLCAARYQRRRYILAMHLGRRRDGHDPVQRRA